VKTYSYHREGSHRTKYFVIIEEETDEYGDVVDTHAIEFVDTKKEAERRVRQLKSKKNPNGVLSQIAVNTAQDVVLVALGCAVVGGVLYLIYKKSTDAGAGVGQDIANEVSFWSSSLFPGQGAQVEQTTPYGTTAETGPGASVQGGAEVAGGGVPGA
jgi:hypothetical protein